MGIRFCAMIQVLFLLHLTALTFHPCLCTHMYEEDDRMPSMPPFAKLPSDNIGGADPENATSWNTDNYDILWQEYYSRRYFYAHNETQIVMARAEAEVVRRQGSGGISAMFPDFAASEDGCKWLSASRDLSFYGDMFMRSSPYSSDLIEILAVDSCAPRREVNLGDDYLEFCWNRWVTAPENPDIFIWDNPDPLTRSLNVLVRIRASQTQSERAFEILADGVYFPATGQMHLVGCTRKQRMVPDSGKYSTPARIPKLRQDFVVMSDISLYEAPADSPSSPTVVLGYAPWVDPDTYHAPPLNSSTLEDCAISVTVKYPPLNCRWNGDRVLKYSIRSKREKDDPLYFDPIERSTFFAYTGRDSDSQDQWRKVQFQRRLETGGRIVLLVLGLICVALQIEHGSHNEESLPFVSLAMLGIQLANHVSQTSIFKDLQIGRYMWRYRGDRYNGANPSDKFSFPDSVLEDKYYGTMAWSEHGPYQAMAMAAIFMYVWIFHKVGDMRRIMKVRVERKRPGAKDPLSDWRVMYATLAYFSLLCFLGVFATRADQYGHLRDALSGMTADEDRYYSEENSWSEGWISPAIAPIGDQTFSPFVSWRFYELSQAQWGFVNRLTGLVVSLFLVPQVVGNMQWDVQGRPLSAWFYMGIPLLQSLPHVCSIAKYVQLLPIFSSFDPYLNSIYGIYENPTPWWAIGVVLCSTLQVLAVHSQFSRSLPDASSHSHQKTPVVQTCDMM